MAWSWICCSKFYLFEFGNIYPYSLKLKIIETISASGEAPISIESAASSSSTEEYKFWKDKKVMNKVVVFGLFAIVLLDVFYAISKRVSS